MGDVNFFEIKLEGQYAYAMQRNVCPYLEPELVEAWVDGWFESFVASREFAIDFDLVRE